MDTLKKKNGNKNLTLVSTDKNKKVLIKYIKFWDKIKNLIKTTHGGEAGDYGKDFVNQI